MVHRALILAIDAERLLKILPTGELSSCHDFVINPFPTVPFFTYYLYGHALDPFGSYVRPAVLDFS